MGRHSGNGHIGLLTFLCVIVGRCSNNGLPANKNIVVLNTRRSTKCGCNAGFTFKSTNGTLISRNYQKENKHHAMCSTLSPTELNRKAHVFRGMQSPQEAQAGLDFVTSMFADDYSTRKIQVSNLANGQIRRSAMNSNGEKLPVGMPHSAPKAYTDMLIRKGKAAANGNISPANALSSFINGLENRNIAHSTLNDTDVNGNKLSLP